MDREQKLPDPLEYLSQYSGMQRIFRAEAIGDRYPSQKKSMLEYCLTKENNSKLVFKLEETLKALNKIIDGMQGLKRGPVY